IGPIARKKRIALGDLSKLVLKLSQRRNDRKDSDQNARDSAAGDVTRGQQNAVRLIGLCDDLFLGQVPAKEFAFEPDVHRIPNNAADKDRGRGRYRQVESARTWPDLTNRIH